MNINNCILKNKLKLKRIENEISQEELALKVGTTQNTISDIEIGKTSPRIKLALLIANELNCKIEDIFYLKE